MREITSYKMRNSGHGFCISSMTVRSSDVNQTRYIMLKRTWSLSMEMLFLRLIRSIFRICTIRWNHKYLLNLITKKQWKENKNASDFFKRNVWIKQSYYLERSDPICTCYPVRYLIMRSDAWILLKLPDIVWEAESPPHRYRRHYVKWTGINSKTASLWKCCLWKYPDPCQMLV